MAIAATAVWEVRTTGSDTNGGGFDASVAAPGTDYSQQAAAQYSLTNGVANGTTTLATLSASADMNGNIVYVAGGTGSITAGWYEVTAVVVGVSLTVDRSTGLTAGTGVTINVGGALATISKSAALAVAGNLVYVKATATYTTATTIFPSNSGTATAPIQYAGFTTVRGDNGQVTLQLTANGIIAFFLSGLAYTTLSNFIFDLNGKTSAGGLTLGSNCVAVNCAANNGGASSYGFNVSANFSVLDNCVASGMASGATAAFICPAIASLFSCRATGNAIPGFSSSSAAEFVRCIADNNTGASSDGFQTTGAFLTQYISCVGYNNGRDGIRNAAANWQFTVRDCILVKNAGYGLNSSVTNFSSASQYLTILDYNAFYSNTSGARNQVPTGTHDVTLTGDPFTNGASNDFSLNATAGAGAACRAAGFPGVLQSGGTGFLDIGALQHQDSGSSGMLYVPTMEGL